MNVLVVHNPLTDLDSVDDADVLVQVQAVEGALRTLGHECLVLAWPEDMRQARESVRECPWAGAWTGDGSAIFNLVESIQGSASSVHLDLIRK